MNSEIHIEELVLHGFNPADRHVISDAVQNELVRLFTEHSYMPDSDSEVPRLRAPVFQIAEHTELPTIGRQVAQSIFGTFPAASPEPSVILNSGRSV